MLANSSKAVGREKRRSSREESRSGGDNKMLLDGGGGERRKALVLLQLVSFSWYCTCNSRHKVGRYLPDIH